MNKPKLNSDPEFSNIRTKNFSVDLVFESPDWHNINFDISSLTQKVTTLAFNELALDKFKQQLEFSILLGDDSKLQELNRDYRGCDAPTNVLSFPNYELRPENYLAELKKYNDLYLGDMALSFYTLQQESMQQGKQLDHHYAHLVIHSILHLLGYDHIIESEAEAMEALEIDLLSKLDIPNPYQYKS